jgi:predicted acetyltransferase
MTLRTEPLRSGQWDQWYDMIQRAFGGPGEPPEERGLWGDLTEIDRSLAVWDGDEVVGTTGAFTFRMTVPGGAVVPTAGVTMVTVQATHRRRGVLTGMMRRQLDEVRELGEPLAVLTASEPVIYGRFGYGAGTSAVAVSVDTARVPLVVPPGVEDVRLRVVAPTAAVAECEAVYARLVQGRPGMLARQPGWERVSMSDDPASRGGAGPLLCVLAERDGEVTGYARYAVRADWATGGPEGVVAAREVMSPDPVSRAALWRYLFGIDLTSKVTCRNLPPDDALFHLVADVRRCVPTTREMMFVRLVDVGAALAARTYSAPLDVVFEVADPFCPWNAGRWRLSGDAKGASCERTGDPADLTLSVRELGSAYLGGVSLTALAAAGRVREERAGALAAASVAFRGALEPWLPHGF